MTELERAAEFAAWGWTATLEGEKRTAAERALGLHGIDGLRDLALAGPALGGLDAADLEALDAAVATELGELLAA